MLFCYYEEQFNLHAFRALTAGKRKPRTTANNEDDTRPQLYSRIGTGASSHNLDKLLNCMYVMCCIIHNNNDSRQTKIR